MGAPSDYWVIATLKIKYRFFNSLVHEIAHLVAFEENGRKIKPHGLEWKRSISIFNVYHFLRPEVSLLIFLPYVSSAILEIQRRVVIRMLSCPLALKNNLIFRIRKKSYIFELPAWQVIFRNI